ncbi:TRAFs-binding domain-containing protein [Listeria booriae]|uniref:TRAFs-binding domain-containing protein n=1 Tax=Listeria booriae TaxID=1552123 RepID=UPI0016283A83|nr:TRAFs-binding domain-containing protein [Listeria booriae]MBC2161834.1 DUF4071 domain-containing protein [Listeria booriae]
MTKNNVCFVIMGYGKKQDYRTGKLIDMDFVYQELIKPAIIDAGLNGIRADEIKHSTLIDIPMYEYLMHADLVIADMSTTNFNAIYELGMRHALRPQSTILISNKDFAEVAPFDVNHISIFNYGDINVNTSGTKIEQMRLKMKELIKNVTVDNRVDSPLYSLVGSSILPPEIKNINLAEKGIQHKDDSLRTLIDKGNERLANEDYSLAEEFFSRAMEIEKDEYLIKRRVLAIYKNKHKNERGRYFEAIQMLNEYFEMSATTDSELLGLAGSIYKRIHELTKDERYLKKAIDVCLKGFVVNKDYYNGINLAFLYSLLAKQKEEQVYESFAEYYRKRVEIICNKLIDTENFDQREDCYWIYATLSEVYYCQKKHVSYEKARRASLLFEPTKMQLEATNEQLYKIKELLNIEMEVLN